VPHDRNGQLVAAGDEVVLNFKVRDVYPGETACNVTLVGIDYAGVGESVPCVSCNSRLAAKLEPAPDGGAPVMASLVSPGRPPLTPDEIFTQIEGTLNAAVVAALPPPWNLIEPQLFAQLEPIIHRSVVAAITKIGKVIPHPAVFGH
jgi:hypothetical protein